MKSTTRQNPIVLKYVEEALTSNRNISAEDVADYVNKMLRIGSRSRWNAATINAYIQTIKAEPVPGSCHCVSCKGCDEGTFHCNRRDQMKQDPCYHNYKRKAR